MKPSLRVQGMFGLGDNFHQRGIIKRLVEGYEVWLETPWPSVYLDMDDVRFVRRNTRLRTQAKNIERERGYYENATPHCRQIKLFYTKHDVPRTGSFLSAMAKSANVVPDDFSVRVPERWKQRASSLIKTDKPIMFYRPLVERTEWKGGQNRNPDEQHYFDLYQSIRDRFYVVSVADLCQGTEWLLGGSETDADMVLHYGELGTQELMGLMAISDLAFVSPGFGLVMAQAVGTPVVGVFGGRESSRLYQTQNQTPFLGIDPINSCECFSDTHPCDKLIAMDKAKEQIKEFCDEQKSKVGRNKTA